MRSYLSIQKIKIKEGGSFYFKLSLNKPSEILNFVVYKTNNNFERASLDLVRCSLSGLHVSEAVASVGLSPTELDTQEGAYGFDFGQGKNGYVAEIDAATGDEYVIVTNVFKPQLILTTTYCGTATFINDDSICDDIFVTTNEASTNAISIYPNPTSELIYLDVSGDVIGTYQLYNSLGQTAMMGNLNSVTIDLKRLESGMYLLKVLDESSKTIFIEKILKQ
jgi:hypothetical protein